MENFLYWEIDDLSNAFTTGLVDPEIFRGLIISPLVEFGKKAVRSNPGRERRVSPSKLNNLEHQSIIALISYVKLFLKGERMSLQFKHSSCSCVVDNKENHYSTDLRKVSEA